MDDQLSTSWILDDSRYLSSGSKMNRMFDIYCRMPSYLKHSIYLVDLDRSLIIELLSLSARTLKVLDLTVSLCHSSVGGLCEELEAMAGHNMLEAFSFEVQIAYLGNDTEEAIGSTIQKVEKVLVKKPGWSALRQVSFKVTCSRVSWSDKAKFSEALQSLPDKYLSHLSKKSTLLLSTIQLSSRVINEINCSSFDLFFQLSLLLRYALFVLPEYHLYGSVEKL